MTETNPTVAFNASRLFTSWMAEERISLAFTTYQSGKVFLLGLGSEGKLSIFERTFNRCMGLHATCETLWMSSLYQLWRFDNILESGQLHEGYDRLYVPTLAHTTGDLDIHDLAVEGSGRVVFVNTLFSCLATLGEGYSFVPLWKPPFVSRLAAEDRCHLNGLAMDEGRPRYLTAVGVSDVHDGWRDHRQGGGLVMDMTTNEILISTLSMPHSPRLYDQKLWLLNSGTGHFGFIDREKGCFEPVAFCPGYLRGLAFTSHYAITGLSRPRDNRTFTGLALDDNLKKHGVSARAGLRVIDLKSGDVVHWLDIEGKVQELYDVVVLPQVQRPMALGLRSDEIRRILRIAPW